jgi:CheY-like chemotaxis protein
LTGSAFCENISPQAQPANMTQEVSTSSSSTQPSPAVLPTLSQATVPHFRVFHVNDSTDDQVLFQAACQKGGVPFNWHVADSAEKGISYLRTLVEHSEKVPVCWPDIVLLDIVMPMVTGLEVLRYIRETAELKHLPVVVFTGHSHPQNREDSIRLGANAFWLKPQDFVGAVTIARDLYRLLEGLRHE